MMVKRLLAAAFLIAPPVAVVIARAQIVPATAPVTPSASGLDLQSLDRTVDPCDDFYEFVCSAWTKNNPIPDDRAEWGRRTEAQERTNQTLRRILESAATASSSADIDTQKIGDYYATCVDERAIDAKGTAPLKTVLGQIEQVTTTELPVVLAQLHQIGVPAFFSFRPSPDPKEATMVRAVINQGGLGLPDRDYYFRSDAKSVALRTQYVAHVARMLGLLGAGANPTSDADAVMNIETALAKGTLSLVARRDLDATYHMMTTAEIQGLMPAFGWAAYLKATGAPSVDVANVLEPEFLRAFNVVITTMPVADVRAYLRWQTVHAMAAALPQAFVSEDFRFYGTTLTGAKQLSPRWLRCVQYTDRDLGEALGKAFVRQMFSATAKDDALNMVHALEGSLEADLNALPWMSDTTKRAAIVKLHGVTNKIGYPDRWRDYSPLRIVRGDAIGNVQRARAFELERQMNRIGKPHDKSLWLMTPGTNNAYNSPLENSINFPAAFFQPPTYSSRADAAVNYGGAGYVIGHELTHGFDDEGRKFDVDGNLKDWWAQEDGQQFQERAACFVDEYSQFTAVDDVKVNGKLTLGENVADNGGARIALMAYLSSHKGQRGEKIDGFTPEQRFFIAFAQPKCGSARPERARVLAQTDPHSPGRYRVNGVVSNMPEFAKAFSCKTDSPMVRENACRIW